MSNPLAYVVWLFKTPSAFWGDWVGYARNQSLHALALGFAPAAVFGIYALPFQVVFYICWELGQWHWHGGETSDCLEDVAFVLGAAAIAISGQWHLLFILALFLLSGIALRRERKASQPLT